MNILEIILIGLSLSMDAFSISLILAFKNSKKRYGIISSFSFSLFQFLMPILGFFTGNIISDKIISYHTYFSAIILIIIGVLMLTEKKSNEKIKINLQELLLLSIATSIDAFIIGISLSFNETSILIASSIIGIITLIMCLIGYFLGYIFNKKAHKYASFIGGITLIILGIKDLIVK